MISSIVQSTGIVTLVGAGDVDDVSLLESLTYSDRIVAADGGAARVLAIGRQPDAVIGDFDSIQPEVLSGIPEERLHPSEDQDTTDFEKAVSQIIAPLILAVGFTGRRLDHELAVYSSMLRLTRTPIIVIGPEDICFALDMSLTLNLDVGTRVSLFPMAEVKCASRGLRWATDHLVFHPLGRIGTSNEAIDAEISLVPSGPGMMVILPRATLPEVIQALRVEPHAPAQ